MKNLIITNLFQLASDPWNISAHGARDVGVLFVNRRASFFASHLLSRGIELARLFAPVYYNLLYQLSSLGYLFDTGAGRIVLRVTHAYARDGMI